MIVLEGLPALSPFRRERLELRLQSVSPGVRIAGAWHVYWIDPEPGASPDPAVLRRVLEAGDDRAAPASGSISRFVAPRLGTISPWASKASEILRGARQPVRTLRWIKAAVKSSKPVNSTASQPASQAPATCSGRSSTKKISAAGTPASRAAPW